MLKLILDRTGPIGGNWVFMVKNQALIGEFIRSQGIKPVKIGPDVAPEKLTKKIPVDLGIYGGIRVAHLHFKDRIYLLNEEQWAKFSGGVIIDARTRLAKVKEVSFEEGMLLGSVAQALAKE